MGKGRWQAPSYKLSFCYNTISEATGTLSHTTGSQQTTQQRPDKETKKDRKGKEQGKTKNKWACRKLPTYMTRSKIVLKMPNLVPTQLLERTKYKTPLRLSCLGFCFDADPTYDVLKVTAKSPYSKARHNPDAAYFCNARKAIYMLLWPLSIHLWKPSDQQVKEPIQFFLKLQTR